MSNHRFHKPENALRRAQELINVGKTTAAVELLHKQFTSPRFRQWQQAYEPLMMKFFDLCVDLRETRKLRDGLHHYRNSAQQQAPSSLETVIKHLVRAAEKRAQQARASMERSTASLAAVEDLDEGESPEDIILGSVTANGSQERLERSMVVPWVRFLWDTYRAVLENLKHSNKLERVYHSTARKAFNFCLDFERKTEFRRLASLLRGHLHHSNKGSNSCVNWSMDTLELHMSTRFAQLEAATQLSLWNEGFRTIEDIHTLIELTQKQPRAQSMATYFEKLTQIFWVADNYLFHAYAWFSFYTLSVAQNRSLTDEEKRAMASNVLLATLCIPLHEGSRGTTAGAFDVDLEGDRRSRLAELLQFPSTPSRAALVEDIRSKGVLSMADGTTLALFSLLEQSFHPLTVVNNVVPLLNTLGNSSDLRQYVPALERLLLTRLVAELSLVYRTVRISFFRQLISGLYLSDRAANTPYGKGFLSSVRPDGMLVYKLPFGDLFSTETYNLADPSQAYLRAEEHLVRAANQRQLQVRVDHANQVLRLGRDAIDSGATSRHLLKLATGMQTLSDAIRPAEATAEAARNRRLALFSIARNSLAGLDDAVTERKALIEKRKEEYERSQRRIAKEQAALAAARTEARIRAEEAAAAAARRERDAQLEAKAEAEAIRRRQLVQLAQLGVDVTKLKEQQDFDAEKALAEERTRAEKAAAAAEAKARAAAKQMDYLTRATREAEWERRKVFKATQEAKERAEYERAQAAVLAEAKAEHEKNLALKRRVLQIMPFVKTYTSSIAAASEEDRAAAREERQRELETRIKRRLYRARRRMEEYEQEQANKAAEEEARRKAEADEARRRQLEAEEAAARAEEAAAEAARRERDASARQSSRAYAPPRGSRDRSPARDSRDSRDSRPWSARREQDAPRERERGGWRARGGNDGSRERSRSPRREGGSSSRYVPPSRRGGSRDDSSDRRDTRDSRDSRGGSRFGGSRY